MRSQTTCSVSLFSSVHILTVRLRGVGLNEVDCVNYNTKTDFPSETLSILSKLSYRNFSKNFFVMKGF